MIRQLEEDDEEDSWVGGEAELGDADLEEADSE